MVTIFDDLYADKRAILNELAQAKQMKLFLFQNTPVKLENTAFMSFDRGNAKVMSFDMNIIRRDQKMLRNCEVRPSLINSISKHTSIHVLPSHFFIMQYSE